MKFLKPTDINQMSIIYKNYSGPYAIDESDLDQIFPLIHRTRVTEFGSWFSGNLSTPNLAFINTLVAYNKPPTILEIGTFKGRTTYNMAMNSPKSQVITIDTPNGGDNFDGSDTRFFQTKEQIGSFFRGKPGSIRITQLYYDSTTKECAEQLDKTLDGRKIDFAFIDGGHTYENVKNDFENLVLPRLNKKGIVVFDDYNRPFTVVGVAHYLMEKAHRDKYVFYWYAPRESENTNEVIFLNMPEARSYKWK